MPNGIHNINIDDDFVVIQLYTARGHIGRPPIETDYGLEIKLTGYAATAMRMLINAGHQPVHVSKMDLDAPARLQQAGIRIRAEDRSNFGTGRAACWIRLDGVGARIVSEAEMEGAA